MPTSPRRICALSLVVSSLTLAGCGSGTATSGGTTPPVTTPVTPTGTGVTFSGRVMAGTLPVQGATVQLYAAGTTGNASAPTRLLSTAATSGTDGAFSVTGTSYTCPADSSVLLLVATGGHVGSNQNNTGIVLAASPATCSAVSANSQFVVNEATTVAASYAFAQFLGVGTQFGASSTNSSGITLAAANQARLVDLTTGSISAKIGDAPAQRIGSLANALHACALSTGASSSACVGLYAATASGTTVSNTLDAALRIAQNPGTNTATLFTLAAAATDAAAFAPALKAAPSDWTLFLTYTAGGLNQPTSLSIDSKGRVWVANYSGIASLFTNTGEAVFPSGITGNNLRESYGAAVDANDNFWIANQETPRAINSGAGNITVLNSSGQPISGTTGFSAGGLNFPTGISFDATNTAWIANYGSSRITLLNSSGVPQSGTSGYADSSIAYPVAVGVDSKRSGYIANQTSNRVAKLSADGTTVTPFTCCQGTSAVAIDGADNAWIADYYGDSIALISSAGRVLSGAGYTGGGISKPQALAVDGAGKIWIANFRGSSISELAAASDTTPGKALSPTAGWGADARLLSSFGLAIDASGNVWVSTFGSNALTEFVGIASPVRTPLLGPVRIP